MSSLGRHLHYRLDAARTALRCRLGIDIEHPVGQGISIRLPPDHRLAAFQAEHPRYDRFLPHLGRALPDGARVIDVGANCGDTLAAMHVAQPGLAFTCIEPVPRYDAYLRGNLERLRVQRPDLDVTIINAMVGKVVSGSALVSFNGTAKQVVGAAGSADAPATGTLDMMIDLADRAAVRLLKVDVDGFDYDVLDSATTLIDAVRPLLFFECQLDHDFQRAGYKASISGLAERGYTHWTVFDNFGGVMMTNAMPTQLHELLDYLWRQNQGADSRTLHYLDLLAASDADAAMAADVVADYAGTNRGSTDGRNRPVRL